MYECLTGRVPFEKDLDAAFIFAHVQEPPTMPSLLRPDLPPAVDEVFARVLAKQPGDRYASCRQFVEAARASLGSLAAAPLAGQSAQTVVPVPQAVLTHRGDTIASHRRPAAEPPPAEPPPAGAAPPGGHQPGPGRARSPRRWFRRPRWIAALTALILVAAGAGIWAGLSGGHGAHPDAMAMSSMSAKPKAKAKPPSALMSAIVLADESGGAKGLLPPSSCKQQSATMVTCTAPAPGITAVVFRTYPSLPALYAAYGTQVKALNSGQFKANFQDCGLDQTQGEVGWNHMFQHPKTYSVSQMSAGMVTDTQAAGRVFCDFGNAQENFVWTQDDGHLLGYVAGPVHEDVWNWWVGVHHNIGFAGSPMNM
jgi:hypothetical protein